MTSPEYQAPTWVNEDDPDFIEGVSPDLGAGYLNQLSGAVEDHGQRLGAITPVVTNLQNTALDQTAGDNRYILQSNANGFAPAEATANALAGKQPLDGDLTALAGLDSATAGTVASDGSGWVKKTYAQLKTALGLATIATSGKLGDATDVTTTGAAVGDVVAATQVSPLGAAFTPPALSSVFQDLIGRIRTGVQDLSILIVSDSTAASSGSWADKLPTLLAAKFPALTISYAKWVDASTAYGTPTVTTGTGSRTLTIWNGSLAGKSWGYALDNARRTTLVTATNPDLIIFSLGHNENNTSTSYYQLRDRAVTAIERIRAGQPGAGIVLLSQNPLISFGGYSEQRADIYRRIAMERGYAFIDVCQAFHDDTRGYAALVSGDNTHPNDDGYILWAATVAAAFPRKVTAQPIPPAVPSFFGSRLNLLTNGGFESFVSPPTLPGWTASNVTLAKDTTNLDTKAYSVQATKTATGSTGYLYATPLAKHIAGREVTLAVRMFIPAGAAGTVGQLAITDGVTSPNFSSSTWSDLRDQWIWVTLTARIAPTATTVQCRILVDPTTGAILPKISIDRAGLVLGRYPQDAYGVDPISTAGATPTPDVQAFTGTGGTWNKPTGAFTRAKIGFSASGGGAGSGRRGADGTIRCGGGSGSHGAQGLYDVAFADLPSTLAITLGPAGVGGAAISAGDTNGNAGTAGGNLTIIGTGFAMQANGGAGGAGGTATSGTGASATATSELATAVSASASTTGGAGNNATRAGNASGAAGAGLTAGNVFSAGGNGVGAPHAGGSTVAPTGGTTDGAAGAAAPSTNFPSTMVPPAGRSGGGGASSAAGAAGAGGAGYGYGYGGSGGGAASNSGGNSGAGSDGGPGCVVIICY